MAENFTYEIIGEPIVISQGNAGWNLELNSISWNKRPAKYDLRSWSSDHEKMGKGVTMTSDELKKLRDVLNSIQIN